MTGSSPVMPAANRGGAADRRFLHDDEAGAIKKIPPSIRLDVLGVEGS